MLPSPDEFAALVAAYPDIPPLPGLATAAEAAVLAGISSNGVLEAHRRAKAARTAGTWRRGMMPEQAHLSPLRWALEDLVEWRAVPSRGAGGGRPPFDDGYYEELQKRARALQREIDPRQLSSNLLYERLGLSRPVARRLLEMIYGQAG
jgi:hypothetical protein